MTTSQKTSIFSELARDGPLSVGVLAYFRERQRLRLYEVVVKEFLRSGITKAELARRMGRKPEQITRWLGAPGNWTLDTISDLLLAISAGELEARVVHPLYARETENGRSEQVEFHASPSARHGPSDGRDSASEQQASASALSALRSVGQQDVHEAAAALGHQAPLQSSFLSIMTSLHQAISTAKLQQANQNRSQFALQGALRRAA